ncbi:MAG: phosphotransferase family protein [Saprospiraceae bacterium]|nr:phosphotransferase family protein [Saprospiraceae bacterium]
MSNNWNDQAKAVRKGEELDIAKLEPFLQEQLNMPGASLSIEQFPGGFSNLTYLIRLGDTGFVLRRPPFGAKIKSAHDMGREYKILHALSTSYSKAPKPLLYTEDEKVIGAPFYVMERVEGVILRPKMPKEMAPAPEVMKEVAVSLIDTFADLHAVDYQAVGLGDLGRPEGYVERQVRGWTKRYFKSKTDEIVEIENVASWLADNQPGESGTALIHNDFKYDNVVLDSSDWTQIIAVLDWEMSTIGDPLMDFGTSLGYWVTGDDPEWLHALALSPTILPGNPDRTEVVKMYAEKSGRDLSDVVFYYVYGLFKIAVIVQQIYYRYKHGYTQDPRFARLNQVVKGLGIMAQSAIHKKDIDRLF